jgi:anti-anti-sigma factor
VSQTSGGLAVDIITDDRPGATVVLVGELDLRTASVLLERTAVVFQRAGAGELTLDLAGVQFCDSAGINALVRLREQSNQHGWQLRTVNPQNTVRRVLGFTGLTEHLNVV